jgi:hypothetical protein
MSYWNACLNTAMRWISQEGSVNKRLLRIKIKGCKSLPWMQTSDLVRELLQSGTVCEVPNYSNWLTFSKFLDNNGELESKQRYCDFFVKWSFYNQWMAISKQLGYYAENLFVPPIENLGYTVEKHKVLRVQNPSLLAHPLFHGTKHVEIDLYCTKGNVKLGFIIKNSLSDVFISPNINRPNDAVRRLIRQTLYCHQNGIYPIFIAPFIEKSCYHFIIENYGLMCQTYLQYFDPANQDLCDEIRRWLNFNNVRVVTQVTPHIAGWISRIPSMWNHMYSASTGITI